MVEYFNGQNRGDDVVLYYRKAGRIEKETITPRRFAWYFCVKTSDVDSIREIFQYMLDDGDIQRLQLDDNPEYTRVYCENKNYWRESDKYDCKRKIVQELAARNVQTYEADVSSVDRYLIDENVPLATKHYIGYYDIETDDRDESGTIETGRDRITSIAVVDDRGKKFAFTHDDEEVLIRAAFAKLAEFTMLCSWYGKDFDWPHLQARAQAHNIKFPLWHVNHVDFYHWFDQTARAGGFDEKVTSMKLNDICETYVGETKTEGVKAGHGRLWKLFMTDRDKLVEYNVQDCALLYKLDNALAITDQVIQQSVITGCFPGQRSNSRMTDLFLLRLARKLHRRLETNYHDRERPKVAPPGGRVYLEEPGLYDGILAFDFAGMYNSIMRTWNVGPDTILSWDDLMQMTEEQRREVNPIISPYTYLSNVFIGSLAAALSEMGVKVTKHNNKIPGTKCQRLILKLGECSDEVYNNACMDVILKIQEKFTISEAVFHEYVAKRVSLNDSLFVCCPNPTFFRQDRKSIVAEALEVYTENRAVFKKQLKDAAPGSPEYINAKVMSNAYKLLGNAMYGQMGFPHSRIYHHCIPPSICLAGQFLANVTGKFFRDEGQAVRYMDTDSNYVQLMTMTKEELLKVFRQKYHPHVYNIIERVFNVEKSRICVELEYEKHWRRVVFLAKKHYAALRDDGETMDIKGIEIVRRETIDYAVKVQQKLLDLLLKSKKIPSGKEMFVLMQKIRDAFYGIQWDKAPLSIIAKRMVCNQRPENYKQQSAIQVRILKRMEARGEAFDYGNVLEYILTMRPPGETKKVGYELNFFDKHRDQFTIDLDEYWNVEIFQKVCGTKDRIGILNCVWPKIPWFKLDTEAVRKADKKYKQQVSGIKKRKDRDKRLRMIVDYPNFTDRERAELLEMLLLRQEKDFPDSPLIEEIKNELRRFDEVVS